ncbi:MAG: type II secretion system protein, partial [Burkholderiaceae bacterium]
MVRAGLAQRGLTYLALLLAVAITSAALGAGASLWSQAQRRERETQLLWAGDQIRHAILAYAQFGADPAERYPRDLEDLLLDPRSPAPRRFLRRIYDDPMTRSTQWGLIRNGQGRIVGVHSRAAGAPLKTGKFAAAYLDFEQARSYADWRFTTLVEMRPQP